MNQGMAVLERILAPIVHRIPVANLQNWMCRNWKTKKESGRLVKPSSL